MRGKTGKEAQTDQDQLAEGREVQNHNETEHPGKETKALITSSQAKEVKPCLDQDYGDIEGTLHKLTIVQERLHFPSLHDNFLSVKLEFFINTLVNKIYIKNLYHNHKIAAVSDIIAIITIMMIMD